MEENYFLKKGMKDNFGFLLKLGGIYSWWTALPFLVLAYIHVILLAYTAYLKLNDVEGLTESLHYVLFFVFVTPNIIMGRVCKKNIENLYKAIGRGFYDYEETFNHSIMRSIIIQNAKKIKKRLSMIYMFLFPFLTGTLLVSRPLIILEYGSEEIVEFDGVQNLLPVICWYPMDTRETLNYVLSLMGQYTLVLLSPCVVMQTAVTFLCFSEEILAQLDVVSLGLETCIERAEAMCIECKQKDQQNKEIFDKFLTICLNHSVKHHQLMIKLFADFKAIYIYILAILLLGTSFLLCLCGLNFVTPEVSLSSKAHFGLVSLLHALTVFIYCYYGELLKQKSAFLNFALYNSDWFKNSRLIKTHSSMVHIVCLKPMKLNAGGFMEVSLSSFSNILSTAYSYFNVLALINNKEK